MAYYVAVRMPDEPSTSVFRFKTMTNARAFMNDLNDMGVDYIFTPEEVKEREYDKVRVDLQQVYSKSKRSK